LTRTMARELGDYNIAANCIAPGATVSKDPSDKAAFEARVARPTKETIPKRCLKRMECPEDLVGTVIFLASSDSNFITGQTIVVDGGDVMY
jgi:NAD(P)-dependent dehydrogenase (short-subunit alcohol dehydrogenase family)